MQKKSHILNPSFHRFYPTIEYGKGIYLYDNQGNEYIDGSSGPVLVSLGHGLSEMGDAMKAQSDKIAFVYRWDCVSSELEAACTHICQASKGVFSHSFLVSGGSEATEIALKLARQYFLNRGENGKYKVISRWQSYHGSTMGVLSVSGFLTRKKGYEPYLTENGHIPPAYCYRCWYGKEPGSCKLECAKALEYEILCQGADTVSAFIMEPISGMSICGAHPPEEYFKTIRAICDKYNVLLIFDEVMTGMGRTGSLFAYQQFGIKPDILALGKALSGGYFPIGAVAITPWMHKAIEMGSGEFPPGYSWSGNPLGAAIVRKTFEILKEKKLVAAVKKRGEYLRKKLLELAEKHSSIGEVRGRGLMQGIEFVQDKETREPFPPEIQFASQIKETLMQNGMIVEASTGCDKGVRGDMIMISPPFIVTNQEIDKIVEILDKVIKEVELRNPVDQLNLTPGRLEI